jgi:hypothetical protein
MLNPRREADVKVLVIILLLLPIALGCAHAVPVDLDLTLPLYYSVGCATDTPDTVKTLKDLAIYASTTSALTDSVLLFTASVRGLYGRPYTARIDRPPNSTWFVWNITWDSLYVARSCKSNVVRLVMPGRAPKSITDLRSR